MTIDRILIAGESAEEFTALRAGLTQEYKPSTFTEKLLVESLAQHHWFIDRAIRLQNAAFTESGIDEKKLAILLRYQSTHERSFKQCLAQLLKLRADMAKELIGFESQKQKQALNDAKINALEAKTGATNLDTEIRATIEAPMPGNVRLPFEVVKPAIQAALRGLKDVA